ncbi:MAG: hypothetical protein MK066_09560 [Crocinitomicaceae bacterium]|nr:hypothetical protein [Crocinitomicaceae bacterium]
MLENSLLETQIINQNDHLTREFLLEAKPSVVIDFLIASHWRFRHELIPRIEQNFMGLIKLQPNKASLPVIFNLFLKFQLALNIHMDIEEKTVFPDFLQKKKKRFMDSVSHDNHEPFLSEIIQLLERSDYSVNPFCQLLIQRLTQFEKELREHAWIEEKIIHQH